MKTLFYCRRAALNSTLNTKDDRRTSRGLNFAVAANKVDLSLAERRLEKENDNF